MHNEACIPIEALAKSRHARILAYPSGQRSEIAQILKELGLVGIESITFTGRTLIDGIPVLGKGCVGIVLRGSLDGRDVAIKIKRTDANRRSMKQESRLLRLANSVGVGPQLVTSTKRLLVTQLFTGLPLARWVGSGTRVKASTLKSLLRKLLMQCWRLDAIGLDHGELSHAPKNVLVNRRGEPHIVDFESASLARRPSNVTSITQYFLFGELSHAVQAWRILGRRNAVIRSLTNYKKEPTLKNLNLIISRLRLSY